MGEAKKRGTTEQRQATAHERRQSEIEETKEAIKKEMDLTSDPIFSGYVVFVPEKDDYLMEITETAAQTHRTYCKSPELAMRYMDRQLAERVAATLPRKADIGLLFDIGKQLLAVFDN